MSIESDCIWRFDRLQFLVEKQTVIIFQELADIILTVRSYVSYLLIMLIATQSIVAVGESIQQTHAGIGQHINSDQLDPYPSHDMHDSRDESSTQPNPYVENVEHDCQHCGHCHHVSQFGAYTKGASLLISAQDPLGFSSDSAYLSKYVAPELRPPIA